MCFCRSSFADLSFHHTSRRRLSINYFTMRFSHIVLAVAFSVTPGEADQQKWQKAFRRDGDDNYKNNGHRIIKGLRVNNGLSDGRRRTMDTTAASGDSVTTDSVDAVGQDTTTNADSADSLVQDNVLCPTTSGGGKGKGGKWWQR